MYNKFLPQLSWWLSSAHQTYHRKSQFAAEIVLQNMQKIFFNNRHMLQN